MANHNVLAMTMILVLVFMTTIDFTVAQVGVCNGMVGSDLPTPSEVVALYTRNNIRRMRIYGPNPATLTALAGSNIELILDLPSSDLPHIAASQEAATAWVQNNVVSHPDVRFRYIAVGNEVSPFTGTSQFTGVLLDAMTNIYRAIRSAGLGDRIRVSTAIDMGLLHRSYPPADGEFSPNASFMNPIIHFLADNNQPLLVNIYPYFAYTDANGGIDLAYALFTSANGIIVPGGTRYQNLFYAMLDAMYAAVGKLGASSSLEIVVSETGWPSAGHPAATMDNARTYLTNLVRHVEAGTPTRPGAIETYIFAMFDENQKPNAETERHFGLFSPNMTSKYSISLN